MEFIEISFSLAGNRIVWCGLDGKNLLKRPTIGDKVGEPFGANPVLANLEDYLASPYVGQLLLVGFNFAPLDWNLCNGAILPIAGFETLYALIGTTYGGDGQSTFGVPDLRGRVAVDAGQGPGLSNYTLGERAGVETVTLVSTQMAQHTHTLLGITGSANSNNPANAFFAGGGQNKPYSDQTPTSSMNPAMVSQVGNSLPHENIQPFQACNWIIALNGIFPSQN